MSLRLISNIRPSNSLSFYYLKVPILKAYLRIYFYKLRVSKNKVITCEVSRLEGLQANYLSVVIYIGH